MRVIDDVTFDRILSMASMHAGQEDLIRALYNCPAFTAGGDFRVEVVNAQIEIPGDSIIDPPIKLILAAELGKAAKNVQGWIEDLPARTQYDPPRNYKIHRARAFILIREGK